MLGNFKKHLETKLEELKANGFYKNERIIYSPQGSHIIVSSGKDVINFCSNNYLGLSNHPKIIEAACESVKKWGYGLSSVRFICGTLNIHKELENKISGFLGTDDTLLYAACFDANGGVFEPLLGPEDAIISDELNHASIIDGVRLCKAKRFRYKHSDMEVLENCLKESSSNRFRLICTDGVFSMDGDIAKLKKICDLAEKYNALVMVDDSHATGYIGKTGRGTSEFCGVEGRVDMITTTFGKALGGASGGCTSGRKEIIEMLRCTSRPYLFSNSLPPCVTGTTIKALELLSDSSEILSRLKNNAKYFREQMISAGFDIVPGNTAIVPVMLYDEAIALNMAECLLDERIYVTGFAYPVVPKGKSRIRVQISAAHSEHDLKHAINSFIKIGKKFSVIK